MTWRVNPNDTLWTTGKRQQTMRKSSKLSVGTDGCTASSPAMTRGQATRSSAPAETGFSWWHSDHRCIGAEITGILIPARKRVGKVRQSGVQMTASVPL